jgi:hypothetical protein
LDRSQIHLRLEPLEERAVPATFRWVGVGGDSTDGKGGWATDARNWADGNGQPVNVAPTAGDAIILDDLARRPLYVRAGTCLACDSITTAASWQGTFQILFGPVKAGVLLEDRLTIEGGNQGAGPTLWSKGQLAINGNGYVEQIGGTFNYTGGEIDYSDNGANDLGYFYIVDGGTLDINAESPKVGAQILVGYHWLNNANAVSAGTLKLSQGTIDVNHNAGISISSMGVLQALGGNIVDDPGTGQIVNSGRVDATASSLRTGMVIRNGGTVEVGKYKTLTIANKFQYDPGVFVSMTQTGGQTILNFSATLLMSEGYVQSGGAFQCNDLFFGADNGLWNVVGWMDIRVGGLVLGDQPRAFGSLYISKSLTLGSGSTLSIDVNSARADVCDKALASGAVTIADRAALNITTSTPQRPSSENRWTFLTGSSISGPFTTITQGGLFTHWIAFIDGNSYKLRAPPITGFFNNILGAIEATPWTGTVATFTDPAADNPNPGMYQATIDWGDGNTTSNATISADGEGGFIVTGSHTWAKWGSYPMTITVQLVDEPFDTFHWYGTGEVADVIPYVVDGGPGATIPVGSTFTSWGRFTDPGADTWTATVDYGDGSGLQPLEVNQEDKTFVLNHNYTSVGEFIVQVTIYDTAEPSDGATWIVDVYDPSGGNSVVGGGGNGGASARRTPSSAPAGSSVLAPVTLPLGALFTDRTGNDLWPDLLGSVYVG